MGMNELIQAFTLGNGAILTNACLLPLYPGLIAFLAGNATNERARRGAAFMGALVLAGILTTMLAVGTALYLLQATFGDVLGVLLPVIYALVIILGVLLLLDRSPFARMSTIQAPVLGNPYATAYVYGLFFGPMTLPCTGPIITSGFALAASGYGTLADQLLYFLFFGLGFGWPLLILPLFAVPLQRRIVGTLARNHDVLNRAAGILLIAIGIFGIVTELLPQVATEFEFGQSAQLLYWGVAFALMLGVGWWTYQNNQKAKNTPADEAVTAS